MLFDMFWKACRKEINEAVSKGSASFVFFGRFNSLDIEFESGISAQ